VTYCSLRWKASGGQNSRPHEAAVRRLDPSQRGVEEWEMNPLGTQFRSGDALIIVDLQRDFCLGGALPVSGGDDIVQVINSLIEEGIRAGALIVASRDWHPPDHVSFDVRGGPWPEHCVRETEGAEFHARLRLPSSAMIVTKGDKVDEDQYSAFDGTGLTDRPRRRGVNRVLICGLAQDVCVRATALDAIDSGFETHVLLSATRPITPAGGKEAIAASTRAGVQVDAS